MVRKGLRRFRSGPILQQCLVQAVRILGTHFNFQTAANLNHPQYFLKWVINIIPNWLHHCFGAILRKKNETNAMQVMAAQFHTVLFMILLGNGLNYVLGFCHDSYDGFGQSLLWWPLTHEDLCI